MQINDKIIKHCLKNVFFITGTAYAGKSTMVKMIAEKYDLIECGENYHFAMTDKIATPEEYPDICYFQTMKGWHEYLSRSPKEYERWSYSVAREIAEFEIAELIHISKSQKVIVDTNIPLDILTKITDYNQVAVMLSPQSMSVEHFFDRDDPDKVFIKQQIMKMDNPDEVMANFKEGIERINSKEHYDEYANSGFFTLIREETGRDTREAVMKKLIDHFGL